MLFEVLAAVIMKSLVFRDITSCGPSKVSRRLGEICHLHFQSRRISQAKLAACFHSDFLLGLFFDPEDEGMFLRNVGLIFNGLHGIISQKIEFFKYRDLYIFNESFKYVFVLFHTWDDKPRAHELLPEAGTS
jgi:hypothetical protein